MSFLLLGCHVLTALRYQLIFDTAESPSALIDLWFIFDISSTLIVLNLKFFTDIDAEAFRVLGDPGVSFITV